MKTKKRVAVQEQETASGQSPDVELKSEEGPRFGRRDFFRRAAGGVAAAAIAGSASTAAADEFMFVDEFTFEKRTVRGTIVGSGDFLGKPVQYVGQPDGTVVPIPPERIRAVEPDWEVLSSKHAVRVPPSGMQFRKPDAPMPVQMPEASIIRVTGEGEFEVPAGCVIGNQHFKPLNLSAVPAGSIIRRFDGRMEKPDAPEDVMLQHGESVTIPNDYNAKLAPGAAVVFPELKATRLNPGWVAVLPPRHAGLVYNLPAGTEVASLGYQNILFTGVWDLEGSRSKIFLRSSGDHIVGEYGRSMGDGKGDSISDGVVLPGDKPGEKVLRFKTRSKSGLEGVGELLMDAAGESTVHRWRQASDPPGTWSSVSKAIRE
ncbi:MAG: hypothetical protein GF416_06770 [Candidatus Altiarchaeales archaeon]|nr:hypothetical protein [Candidatus Altiarchaeales archaeon]MBD3416816.1 hypothetical protein [Candidatus Altiarchaeales archaeon]